MKRNLAEECGSCDRHRKLSKPNHLQTGGAGVSKDALRNKRRVVKLVTIVTVMFALSWLPIQVIVFVSMILYAINLMLS